MTILALFSGTAVAKETFTISVNQFVEHPALDAVLQVRIDTMGNGNGRYRSPQRQTSINGQIRKIQYPEGQINPDDHDPVYQTLFNSA